jgi:hypothetical protein
MRIFVDFLWGKCPVDYFKVAKFIFNFTILQRGLFIKPFCLMIMARIMFCFKGYHLWMIGFVALD